MKEQPKNAKDFLIELVKSDKGLFEGVPLYAERPILKAMELYATQRSSELLGLIEAHKKENDRLRGVSRVSGEPPKPDQRIQHIKDVLNDGDMRLALHLLEELTGGSVPTPSDEPLRGALTKIIEMNRQHAQDQYGDANKAESWACVTVAREALRGDKKSESSIPNKESRP